jgi:hypothetical protein
MPRHQSYRRLRDAYPHRGVKFVMNVLQGGERGDEQGSIGWARELCAGNRFARDWRRRGNFVPDDETDRVAGPWAAIASVRRC